MNQKDIRDIAAYWGAPLAGCVVVDMKRANGRFSTHVDANYLDGLAAFGNENAKVQLRHIQSLIDAELTECAKIDASGDFLFGGVYKIDRYVDEIAVYYGNGASVHFAIPHIFYVDQHAGRPAPIIAYLQSIGIYVPGSIDPQYVELLP